MYPKILDIGPITIHAYGLLLALAFIVGIWITSRYARREGLDADQIWNLGLIVIFAALVGAKLLLFLSDYSYYSENPREIFSLSTLKSTGIYYGGLILAIIASFWFLKASKLPVWRVADLAAPGMALGQAIGQIGCLSAGCAYGKPTSLPWGITFRNTYASESMGVPLNVPLHPTQIYEAIGYSLLFFYLTRRITNRRFTGQAILEYLLLSACLSIVIEFLRNDERGFVLHGLISTSQLIAILTLVGSLIVYYFVRPREPEAARP